MQDDTHDLDADGVKLVFGKAFEPNKLSERELECLRAFLPGLIMELNQAISEGENKE